MGSDIDMLSLMLARAGKERSNAAESYRYGIDPARYVKFESEKRESMDDTELNAYCQQWVHWCWTRKYFIRPGAPNILARMQPSKSSLPPDAVMSDEISFFNMAVHALADMPEHKEDAACFVSYYWDRASNIKVVAAKMDIGRRTFYERMYRFARKSISMANSLRRVHAKFAMTDHVGVD
jgi:hypothetical protein